YMFRKLLRDAVRGTNPKATPQEFANWLRENGGAPNSYCSGNVFDLPVGRTREEEVTLRRHLAREVVAIITQAEVLKGKERADFVKTKMEALQQDVLARRAA
ncbi:MAG: (2Fe-2S)-binding protein, partial [Comamonadaceae bacterium]|nr:(2Fe-2S)-binding protein [Comamonadaceae bacterium]